MSDSGATSTEYAILAALIAVVVVGTVRLIGKGVDDLISPVLRAFGL